MKEDETPIPPYAENALAVIVDAIPDDQPGIGDEAAQRTLVEEGYTTADAADVLEILEMRGYVYRVDSELRITD